MSTTGDRQAAWPHQGSTSWPSKHDKLCTGCSSASLPLKPSLHLHKAANGLVWAVCILLQLPRVSKVVGPKRKKLAEAESQLEVANRQLKEKQDALAAVVLRVNSLKHQLADAESEQRQLNAQVRAQHAACLLLSSPCEGG